jgi:triosephosphate isomerase (TIM)
MPRTQFIAGNWKMNTVRGSAVALAAAVASAAPREGIDVGIAPPFPYLESVGRAIAGSPVWLGAQDCHFEPDGAFTGEVSVEMLKDLGARFCLAGHSERRHVIGEGGELIARKAAAIYAGGLVLVHCVGEKIEQRDAGQTLAVVERQLSELQPVKIEDPARLVVAYEPVWAIGTGRIATDEQAQEVHAFVRQTLSERWSADFADRVRIQYGGSVKAENCSGIFGKPDVDGALVGGASLKAESFLGIVRAAMSCKR